MGKPGLSTAQWPANPPSLGPPPPSRLLRVQGFSARDSCFWKVPSWSSLATCWPSRLPAHAAPAAPLTGPFPAYQPWWGGGGQEEGALPCCPVPGALGRGPGGESHCLLAFLLEGGVTGEGPPHKWVLGLPKDPSSGRGGGAWPPAAREPRLGEGAPRPGRGAGGQGRGDPVREAPARKSCWGAEPRDQGLGVPAVGASMQTESSRRQEGR